MQKFDKVLTCHDRKQKLYKSPEIFYEKFVKLTGHSHTGVTKTHNTPQTPQNPTDMIKSNL